MVRHKDPHWKYAEKLDDNHFKCNFCKVDYPGGISRIKSHLSNISGRGIKLCPKVPRDVQREVTREIESSNRKRKALSSSFDDEGNNTVSTSSQNHNNEVGIQARGSEDRNLMELHNPEQQVEEGNHMNNNVEESVQSVKTRGITLVTEKLVGQQFRKNLDQIWDWLVNDKVSSIGIYGMAGVGKTELVKHINNKLLKDPNPFHHVYWFTVPQDFSLDKLQNAIAKIVGVDILDEIDERRRAGKLFEALLRNGKCILILDDVWNDINLQKVGIPVRENGCKLILTSRSFDVCRVMACEQTIKVFCLYGEEEWDLFKEILGYRTTLSDEVEEIARDVVEKCEGLPLALVTIARRMRGMVDKYQWRNALDKLEGPTAMQDYKDVFQKLKLSYDHLDNSAMQQCFLYFVLFQQHMEYPLDEKELIEYLIDEGIIERMRSRQQEIDEGYSIFNTLKNVCLLEQRKCRYMHEWIRKMALQILSREVMVITDVELEEFLDEERWTQNLLRGVLVLHTWIKEIPPNFSPSCPNLSTLYFSGNYRLKLIPDSFFKKLSGLKVFHLSSSRVGSLPSSFFNLVGLVALLLRDCKELKHVPSLANLRGLEKLDMSESGVEEVPEGMKLLSKLRYLDLSGTKLRDFPVGILPNLLRLQFLKLNTSVLLLQDELKRLSKLELLQCGLDEYVFDLRLPLLNKCNIAIGLQEIKLRDWSEHFMVFPSNIKKLLIENGGDGKLSLCDSYNNFTSVAERLEVLQLESLKDLCVLSRRFLYKCFVVLREIKINNCSSIKNLFNHLCVSNIKNLVVIKVTNCSQMEEIIETFEHEEELTEDYAIATIKIALPKLRTLYLRNLKKLKSICKGNIICDSIEDITIIDCTKLKRMPLSLSLTDNMQPSPPPLLRKIKVYPGEWWELLDWGHPNAKNVLQPLVKISWYD